MGDAAIPLERAGHGFMVEQQSRSISQEAPPHASDIVQSQQINLKNFYENEVARHKVELPLLSAKALKVMERNVKKVQSTYSSENDQKIQPKSLIDKVHRRTMLLLARLEGVRDLDRFEKLIDYFETTVYQHKSKYVNLPKGLSEEQKNKIIEKWKAKGWNVSYINDHERNKYANLTLSRSTPLRIERQHIKLIKQLISADNDPVEIAKGLQKMGFWFGTHILKSKSEMKELGELFTASHAKEAFELAQVISTWGRDWFTIHGANDTGQVKVGQIEFLIKLAQSPDPKAAFPPELVKRINTLSTALNMTIGVAEIDQLQKLMENPDHLDLAVYLLKLGGLNYTDGEAFFEGIIALDQEGLLKPVVELYRSGVSVESIDTYYETNGVSLRELFYTSQSNSKHQEVQQNVFQYLRGVLGQSEIQTFLRDTKRREFVGLLGELRGVPLSVKELSNLDKLFGEDLARAKEAIFVLKLLQSSDKDVIGYNLDLQTLAAIVSNPNIIKILTDEEFPKFIKALESKAGYIPSPLDLYFQGSSRLAEVFSDSTVRAELTEDATTEVIKALGGGINLHKIDFYIRLGKNSNMVQAINALNGMGCQLYDSNNLPSEEMLEAIANDPSAIAKLESPELKSLAARLTEEFNWKARSYEINNLLTLYDSQRLQQELFDPKNLEYIKKMRPGRLFLSEVRPMLDLDVARRDLMVKLVSQFSFHPEFSSLRSKEQQEMLDKLVQNDDLRIRLFSEQTQEIFKRLQKDFGYHLQMGDIDILAKATSDLPNFIGELKEKYKYSFHSKDLASLISLATNREGFNSLLNALANHGYEFKTEDIANFSQLMPYAERLPAAIAVLGEVIGYEFNARDSQQLIFIIEGGYTKDRLIGLKQIYDKYKDPSAVEFNIGVIQKVSILERNEEVIARLENYNYKFQLQHVQHLRELLESTDKNKIFQALDILRDNLPFAYNPNLSQYYMKLAQIPGLGKKLREIGVSIENEDLMQENNFKLFVALRADAGLYNHARKLLSDDYFKNIRDAQNRFAQFNNRMLNGEIPDEVLMKIFVVSGKATELDRIAFKYGINAEIAKAAENSAWFASFLQTTNFQEANEVLTRMMSELAIPVIYSSLDGEKLSAKQNELIELAGKDKEFDDILEIACRSVGVYGQKYPNKGREFDVLMSAIKQSLELNLERNPKAYLEKRAELSSLQFDRIFEGMPKDVRERVMKTWLDLSPSRRLRVSGDMITAEEATLSRLIRIRDIVHTDLSVHFQELFKAKIAELEASVAKGEASGSGAEQLAIYKRYLMTPEGTLRQDIPLMYRSVEAFVRDAQTKLKNPMTPKDEKAKLGKSLGTYQAISDSLKALYRLGTISEERYKARRDYLNEIEKHIGEFSGALKRLKILDPDRRSLDVNTRALEEEVLLDFGKLKGTMAEENVSGQTMFETESTVAFRNLARAPEITQSCQRLTEVTGYNHAAYSRLLDGSNEMIDIYEMRNGERNRLARSFIELSKVRFAEGIPPRLTVLIDRDYVNPQYQNFGYQFSSEMMLHLLDRISGTSEVSLIFDSNRFTASLEVQKALVAKGYQLRQISGEYFINESNVKLAKYYDSLDGVNNVDQSSWKSFTGFYIIEKV